MSQSQIVLDALDVLSLASIATVGLIAPPVARFVPSCLPDLLRLPTRPASRIRARPRSSPHPALQHQAPPPPVSHRTTPPHHPPGPGAAIAALHPRQLDMPSFLDSIRRRSRISSRSETNGNGTSSGDSSNDGDAHDRPQNKSSSTLNSWFDKSSPPTTLSSSQKSKSNNYLPGLNGNANGAKAASIASAPARPRLQSSNSNRYSLLGLPLQDSESAPRPTPVTSPYAPRVLSISDGSWVHQKVLLIFGECADAQKPLDGQLTVTHHQESFPTTQWPVCDSHFKALVYLQSGPNRLRLDFVSPKLSAPMGQLQTHSAWISINFLPLISSPPIHLCILVAHDSPETYDAVPERVQKEGNNLATAIRKFRMAAYLWQAFTAEQMNRNGFGRRCYRYEEEWYVQSIIQNVGIAVICATQPLSFF